MNVRNLFIINAVVALLFGLAFVLVPTPLLELYGISLSEGGLLVGRLFGAALLGYGVLTWLVRDAGASEVRQAILLALFLADAVGFVASLLAQFAGVANALGWTTVAIYLVLAAGFGYFRFMAGEGTAEPRLST